MALNSRTILNLKVNDDRILPVCVDIDNEELIWMNTQSFRIFSILREAIVKDFEVILGKEKGVIVVKGILSFEFRMVTSTRRDHILLAPNFARPEVFPYTLKVKVHQPDHIY
jgi:hypothetical protein